MAAGGYPSIFRKNDVIHGLADEREDVKVFHAGTAYKDGQVFTSGGRVLCVTALGENVLQAQLKAYGRVRSIHWEKAHFRTDIGYRAIARPN